MAIIDIRSSPRFKPTVLLVDDQPTVLSIHAAILNTLDWDLTVAIQTNPLEALAYLAKRQVDLLITDFKMPGIDGIWFIKQAKSLSRNPHLQIIVITALKTRLAHERILAAGAARCFTKPAQCDELAKISYELLHQCHRSHIDKDASGKVNA